MQPHLHLCLFLFGLLALVSLVNSYVVLSPQDVSRLGRQAQDESADLESNIVDLGIPNSLTKRNPFNFQEDGLAGKAEDSDSTRGMLVSIAFGSDVAAKSTLQRKPSAAQFSLVSIVRRRPFILAHGEVSADREFADVTDAETPSSSHKSLRVHHVLSRMSHALKELSSTDPLTQTVTDKAEDLVAVQRRRMASKPIMRRPRRFNSEMHDETEEESAISDQNEFGQFRGGHYPEEIKQDVKIEAEEGEAESDLFFHDAPSPTRTSTTPRVGWNREEDVLKEPVQEPQKESDLKHHGHHHHEKDGERHHDGWHRRMDACQSDISNFCVKSLLKPREYSNDDFGMVECLAQHKSKLSSQCTQALYKSTIFQCAADARAVCSTELDSGSARLGNGYSPHEQKHRIINCLETKVQFLSANCLTAINNRRSRHGKEPILPGYPDDPSSVAPPSDPKPPRHASSENESHGGKGPKWAVIAIVGLSAAFVFMSVLAVVILVQRKRRRQQQAVLEAANSLNIPPPPIDVITAQTIRVTEEVSMAPMAMPYYRMDDAQAV